MRAERLAQVALELSSPTRMERYLRDVFGLQLLAHGYWRGEYVRMIGVPGGGGTAPLVLYNRPFIPRCRLRYIAVALDVPVEDAVAGLRRRGYAVDGEDILQAPGGLAVRITSRGGPRPAPVGDPSTRMAEVEPDPAVRSLVRGVHHVALDVSSHAPTLEWLSEVFGMDRVQTFDRRGEFIRTIKYGDAPVDAVGRQVSLLPLFLRPGIEATRLNHIAFDVADADGAIMEIEAKGVPVDLWQDAMIHGPEDAWYQIDSSDTPFPIGHPANHPGVPLFPYTYD